MDYGAQFEGLVQKAGTPLLATTLISPAQRYPLPLWKPRSGRNITYVKWDDGRPQALRSLRHLTGPRD